MRQLVSIILAFVLVTALSACGTEKNNNEVINNSANNEVSSTETVTNNTAPVNSSNETSSNVEWKQFLKEYEEWVDRYIEVLKKYKANPSDMSILSDYTEMMTELTEWSEKADEVQADLENASPQELAEYSKEVARIATKIAEAAY